MNYLKAITIVQSSFLAKKNLKEENEKKDALYNFLGRCFERNVSETKINSIKTIERY